MLKLLVFLVVSGGVFLVLYAIYRVRQEYKKIKKFESSGLLSDEERDFIGYV